MKKLTLSLMSMVFALSSLVGVMTPQFAQAKTTTQQPDPALAQEYVLLLQYIQNAPKMPTKTVKDKIALAEVEAFFTDDTIDIQTFADFYPFLSQSSLDFLAQAPMLKSIIEQGSNSGSDSKIIKVSTPKIYKGSTYASIRFTEKDKKGHISNTDFILIKENGKWKMDLIQMMKVEFKKQLKNIK